MHTILHRFYRQTMSFLQKKGLLFSFFFLSAPAFSITLPLNYNENHGDYALMVLLAGHEKPLRLMLDTGSSNLNVVGDATLCPQCEELIAGNRFTPKAPAKPLKHEFFMRYGLGDGKLRQFQGPVNVPGKLTLEQFHYGVYEQGKDINNIVGFAYPQAADPRDNPTPPFFTRINQKYKLQDEFSLLLCDVRAPSWLFLGPLPAALGIFPHHEVAITKKELYFVGQYGVSDKHGRMLVDLPGGGEAIIDSGTTAKIIYPDSKLAPLITYLKKHTSKKNQALPEDFWRGRACLANELVDEDAFPDLYFHFKDRQGHPFRLKLPAKRYITSSACGAGYVKLAFIGYQTNKTDTKTPNHKKNYPSFVILGTPFLEEYLTTFKQDNPATLIFHNSTQLCNDAYQARIKMNDTNRS
ncbi:pepsin-like aspartic protease [Legionella nagasakiensis]|uniref:pepsin-like aspartic protease n=1 Tax=Legionella nagasakiensis TaxID=535290 RepID=UPI0013EFA44D|nr:pepsin-like aspartic protease [Legionella nagasakiensis]